MMFRQGEWLEGLKVLFADSVDVGWYKYYVNYVIPTYVSIANWTMVKVNISFICPLYILSRIEEYLDWALIRLRWGRTGFSALLA